MSARRFTDALTARVPGVGRATEVAFMDGLSRGSLVIGLMCLVGWAFAWAVLPGSRYDPLAEGELASQSPALTRKRWLSPSHQGSGPTPT